MQFDYKDFHIDASPLDEGGHYYARAKIYQRASVGGDTVEVKWSGDLGDYPSDADAIEAAQRWAIQWCDENSARPSDLTPRIRSLETVMQPCNACRELVGKPSSVPPHGDLAASGVSAIGPPIHMTKISSNWNCTVCGSWLYQNTADGTPPNEWVMGEHQLDSPEKA